MRLAMPVLLEHDARRVGERRQHLFLTRNRSNISWLRPAACTATCLRPRNCLTESRLLAIG
jgi:hypothetical protein